MPNLPFLLVSNQWCCMQY